MSFYTNTIEVRNPPLILRVDTFKDFRQVLKEFLYPLYFWKYLNLKNDFNQISPYLFLCNQRHPTRYENPLLFFYKSSKKIFQNKAH